MPISPSRVRQTDPDSGPALVVRRSKVHGLGVFATRAIRKGEVIDDPERMFTLGISVFERYMGATYTEAMKPAVEAMLHKRVVVKVNVDKVVSWDHRKLGLGTR